MVLQTRAWLKRKENPWRWMQLRETDFHLLCIKEAFLAIDPSEYQINSNWSALRAGKTSIGSYNSPHFLFNDLFFFVTFIRQITSSRDCKDAEVIDMSSEYLSDFHFSLHSWGIKWFQLNDVLLALTNKLQRFIQWGWGLIGGLCRSLKY